QSSPQIRDGRNHRDRCERIGPDSALATSHSTFKGVTPIIDSMDGSTSGSLRYIGGFFCHCQNGVIHGVGALLNCILGFLVNYCHVKSPEYWHLVPVLQYLTSG